MQFKNILSAAVLGLLAVGCNRVDFKKTKSGMPYKIYSDNKSAKLRTGDFVKIHYSVKVTNNGKDSLLQSTREQGQPFYMPVSTENMQPYDINEIIPLLRKGDSAVVIQSVDTFLKRNPVGAPKFFKKGGKLTTTFKVIDIFRSEEEARADEKKEKEQRFFNDKNIQGQLQKDVQALQSYFSQHGIKAQKTTSGAYVEMLSSGSGPKIQTGDQVEVFYTGRTLEGKVFDSNVDTSFHHAKALPVRVNEGQTLRGFEEGLAMLKEGDKARIYIPSPLAYGAQGVPQIGIAPNAILIFDVEPRRIVPKGETAMPQEAPPAGQ
jgi:FKBP-type peptidyl-prolyl cis-trans isomerase FkpA